MNAIAQSLVEKLNTMLEEKNVEVQLGNVKFLLEKDIFSEMSIERTAKNAVSKNRFLGTRDYKAIVNDAIDFVKNSVPCHKCGEPSHYLDDKMNDVCVLHAE